MKIKLIILLTITLIITSCSKSKKDKKQQEKTETTLPIIKIRPPEGELPNLRLSEIAEDIKYIKLETTDDCLVGDGKVHYSKDSKYIFIRFNYSLYQFDTSGKFIRKIGRKGQGPNEFMLQRLAVDYKNKILYAYPLYIPNTIFRFDFNGKPLEKIKNELLIHPEIFTTLNSQLIFANNPYPYVRKIHKGGYMQLFSLNTSINKINYYLPNYYHFNNNKKKYSSCSLSTGMSSLSKFKNKAYYWCAYKDTMYQITSDTITPYIIMDLGKYKFNYNKIETPLYNYNSFKKATYNKIFIEDMIFTNKHILFSFTNRKDNNNNKCFIALYNKKSKKIKYYKWNIINDLTGGFSIVTDQLKYNKYIIYTIDRLKNTDDELYNDKDKYPLKFPERKNELKKILDNSDIEDNPIIPIITIREDF